MRIHFIPAFAIALIAASCNASPAAAQDVAVVEIQPYAMQDENGAWHGPAVDLFRAAADAAGFDYRFVPAGTPDEADAARTTLPVFAAAELPEDVARSLPLHVDSVGLVGSSGASIGTSFIDGLGGLFNLGFLKVVAVICVLLLIVGTIFWLVEKSDNEDVADGESKVRGVGDGFWWAGVTATTIGYGDLVPKTASGRIVAMVWMLISMALTAILTAYLVSLTGLQGMRSAALGDAVSGRHVGVVTDGPVQRRALENAQAVSDFPSFQSALEALDAGRIDLVAYPYQAAKSAAGSQRVQRTSASVAMPLVHVAGSERLRLELDRIILSPEWQQRMEDQFSSR